MSKAKPSDLTRDVRRVAKLLRDGGYSYDQSKHLIAEARRLVETGRAELYRIRLHESACYPYLENGGSIENAQAIAATLEEVERIGI